MFCFSISKHLHNVETKSFYVFELDNRSIKQSVKKPEVKNSKLVFFKSLKILQQFLSHAYTYTYICHVVMAFMIKHYCLCKCIITYLYLDIYSYIYPALLRYYLLILFSQMLAFFSENLKSLLQLSVWHLFQNLHVSFIICLLE